MAHKVESTQNQSTKTARRKLLSWRRSYPTDEQIRRGAYEIYEVRCHEGACADALADWITAEAELKAGRNGHEERE